MSKDDVIQMQGEVVENLPERDIPREAGKRSCGVGAYFGKDAHALHTNPAG
jgi:hypothetical protein